MAVLRLGQEETQLLMPERRRFPIPWTVEETDACFIIRDAGGQALAYVYFEDEPGRRSAASLLTRGAARCGQHRQAAGAAEGGQPAKCPSGNILNPDPLIRILDRRRGGGSDSRRVTGMWTAKNRGRYDRSKLRYPSDLTDDEWGARRGR